MVCSTYQYLVHGGCRLRFAKVIWNSRCPLNVRIFLWVVVKDVILTWNNLQKRRLSSPSVCILGGISEIVSHIMTQCSCSNLHWTRCAQQAGLTARLPPVHSVYDRIISIRKWRKKHAIVVAAMCWNI